MIRPILWLVALLLLALVSGIAVNAAPSMRSRGDGVLDAGVDRAAPTTAVVAVHPIFTKWQDSIETAGVIAPWQEAVVSAQIGGFQIVELRADVGDVVEKGQVLAVLNPSMLQAQRAELQARLDRAVADWKRASVLSAQGNLSEKSLLQAETEEKIARALIEQKLLEIKYAIVVAPDSGIIVSRSAMLGQVSQLDTELFRITRQRRLEWRAEVAASDLSKVLAGQSVNLDLPDGGVALGVVRAVSPGLDETTRRGLIYVDLVEGGTARAGMYAAGRIILANRQALVVPAASLLIKDGRRYVAKLSGAGSRLAIELAPVAVAGYSGDQAEIADGLSPIDTIVGEGAGLLDDGDRVHVARELSLR